MLFIVADMHSSHHKQLLSHCNKNDKLYETTFQNYRVFDTPGTDVKVPIETLTLYTVTCKGFRVEEWVKFLFIILK